MNTKSVSEDTSYQKPGQYTVDVWSSRVVGVPTDEPGRPDVDDPGRPPVEPGPLAVEPGRVLVEPGRNTRVEPGLITVEPGLNGRAGPLVAN